MCNIRVIPCQDCHGDRGWSVPVGIDYRNGALIEREVACERCEATGEEEIELEPVEQEDLL